MPHQTDKCETGRVDPARKSVSTPHWREQGFTLIELAVVVCIVAILFTVAIDKYLDLLVDVERATMEQNLGAMRSAVALQMASRLVKGNSEGAAAMAGENPMRYMSETPFNYLGELDSPDPAAIAEGNWYYDTRLQAMVYRVRNDAFFRTPLDGPPRARFRIEPVFDENASQKEYLAGLVVRPLETYKWLKSTSEK